MVERRLGHGVGAWLARWSALLLIALVPLSAARGQAAAPAEAPASATPVEPPAQAAPAEPSAAPAQAPQAAADDHERWYVLEIEGQPCGMMRSAQRTENLSVITEGTMELALSRGEVVVRMKIESSFTESLDGKPISMKVVQRFGGDPTTVEAFFGETEVRVHLDQTTMRTNFPRPLPAGEWLTPARATRELSRQLRDGASRIVVRTLQLVGGLDPMSALEPIVITRKDIRKDEVTIDGAAFPALRATVQTSSTPGIESVEYLDKDGIPLRSETKLGGFTLLMRKSTKEEALASVPSEEGQAKLPEIMLSSFVTPDKAIERPRMARRAVYVLSVPEGAMPMLPNTGSQRAIRIDERTVRVEVDIYAANVAPPDEVRNQSFRQVSALVQAMDPTIKELTTRALAGAGEIVVRRAEALRKFVNEYIIDKNLGVGFASAAETAATKQGDCTEHAVLLAAMLRADLISSRVASGLVYVENPAPDRPYGFGYHMWTQALVAPFEDPVWVDLDATMPGPRPFDATHIALSTSALADGEPPTGFVQLSQLLGRLQIKVETIEY